MERIVGFNHDVLIGIRDFAIPQRSWICHFAYPATEHIQTLARWQPDGLLCFLFNTQLTEGLLSLGIPVVDVANWIKTPVPRVCVDDVAVGAMAGTHFLDLGLERFAFVGRTAFTFADERYKGFCSSLAEAGYAPNRFEIGPGQARWEQPWSTGSVDRDLRAWLEALPKPVAIFCDNDERALLVSEACYVAGIDVPNQVAILGVDNDPYLGPLGYPALSSIAIPARKVGFEAAALLNRLMMGGRAPSEPIRVPPIGVISRRSTDLLAIDDPYLASAVRFIRENAALPIDVSDVVGQVPISRRTLEKLFRDRLGRSPLEEIRRMRILKAQQLLASTDLTVDTIAEQSGFGSGSWLSANFRDTCGITPGAYRRQFQSELVEGP